jgi:hypothetical protein
MDADWQQQPRPASNLSFDSVWHVVMVPSYKEPIDKVSPACWVPCSARLSVLTSK